MTHTGLKFQSMHLVSAMGIAVMGIFWTQFFAVTTLVIAGLTGALLFGVLYVGYKLHQKYKHLQAENKRIKKSSKNLQDALDVQIYEADALRHTLKEIGFEMHTALDRDLTHMGEVIENILDNQLAEIELKEGVSSHAETEDNIAIFSNEKTEHRDRVGMAEIDLSHKELAQYLELALEHKKVDVYAQPVVALPSRHIIGYELFSRIWADGQGQIPAAAYLDVAQREDKMPALDNALLIKAMLLTRKFQENSHCQAFFINLSPLTLHDAQFMAEMVAFLARYRVLAPCLVFEMPQSAYQDLTIRQKKNIDALAKAGCRFSMDQVWHFDMDMRMLSDMHVSFVKTEAQDIILEMEGRKGYEKMRAFQGKLSIAGISWIIEKIENERDLLDVLDLDVNHGQGYLFEEPQPLDQMMETLTQMAVNN